MQILEAYRDGIRYGCGGLTIMYINHTVGQKTDQHGKAFDAKVTHVKSLANTYY